MYRIKLKGNKIHALNPPKYIVTHKYILNNPIIIHIKGNDRKNAPFFKNPNTFFFSIALKSVVITKQLTTQVNEKIIPIPFTISYATL